ncbi:MAG: VacJ family lipoprotein [Methylococcales bacterium]|nr:VacJ family lipoprotein [Methylococcales bacterium]
MNNRYLHNLPLLLSLLLSTLLMTGCSLTPKQQAEIIPAQRTLNDNANIVYPIRIYDPLEGFNRSSYKFNAKFDQYVFLPIVHGYEYITPEFVQTGIDNFFSNLGEITNLTNSIFQLKPESSIHALSRFVINSTVGVAGFWDHATDWRVLEQPEDFGQTLGYYGVGDGPYLVLPILGPMNTRDGAGLLVDSMAYGAIYGAAFDFSSNKGAATGFQSARAINARKQMDFRYNQSGTPFEYDFVRYLYTQKRKLEIAK